MRKDYLKWIALFVLFCFVFCLAFYLDRDLAYADALTISAIGGISYALMGDWGISLNSVNNNSTSVSNFISGQLTDYVNTHGGSISSLFGSEIARITAGKLVVGYQLYNGVKDFIDWMKEQFNFGDSDSLLYAQTNDSTVNGNKVQGITGSQQPTAPLGIGAAFWNITEQGGETLFRQVGVYSDQVYIFTGSVSGYIAYTGNYYFKVSNNQLVCCVETCNYRTHQVWTNNYALSSIVSLGNLNWNGENYVEPTVLNPTQGWEGTIGGQDWPDTNLDELIGSIYEDVADNNLDVDGEIIDVPVPPSPQPTVAPDIPLQDVPWQGLNDLIGNTAEGIQEQIQSQTQSITSTQEATTEAVESLTDTLTDALDVPDEEELPDFKFDLRELFPFCIPFDIYRLLSSFDAQPHAPHVQIPIVIESIGFSHNLDLDFSAWNPVAQAMRTAELIVYAIALAWATGKVIKW